MDFHAYKDKCAFRWEGHCLQDARSNWALFAKHHADLVEILRPYLADCYCPDLTGASQNPEGTLSAWLWKCSDDMAKSWIWDFCAHYQKCHLRRGLLIYCEQLINELKATPEPAALVLISEH